MKALCRMLVPIAAFSACIHFSTAPSTEPISFDAAKPQEPMVVAPTPDGEQKTDGTVTITIVPDRLKVTFTKTEIATASGDVPVWHWISSGLATMYQREIAVTLLAESADGLHPRMEWVAGYYAAVFGYAERGRLVDAGSLTGLGAQGAFGRADLRGVLYVDSDGSGNLTIPPNTLSALFLTADEYSVAADMGPSRVLGARAASEHYFPFPFWSDLSHTSIITPPQVAGSVLTHMRRAMLPECSIVLEDKAHLVLRVPKSLRNQLSRLEEIPIDEPTALLTGVDSEADSMLVWVRDATDVTVIGRGNDEQKRLSGAFLGIATNEKQVEGGPIEDGFVVMIPAESWRGMRQALLDGRPFDLKIGEGFPDLALVWIDRSGGNDDNGRSRSNPRTRRRRRS